MSDTNADYAWDQTVLCHPEHEAEVAAACPPNIRIRTPRFVPAGRVYVMNDAVMDLLGETPFTFSWQHPYLDTAGDPR